MELPQKNQNYTQGLDDKVLGQYILSQTLWDNLPQVIQKYLYNNQDHWRQEIVRYSLKFQLRWAENLVRFVIVDERNYYELILRTALQSRTTYPYHLSDVLINGLSFSPIKFYSHLLQQVIYELKEVKDILPLALLDCCRILGISEDFLKEQLSRAKSKIESGEWQRERVQINELLTTTKVQMNIPYWWIVRVGLVLQTDVQQCNEIEHSVIDSLIVRGPTIAGELDKDAVYSLYNRELIYLEVPVGPEDIVMMVNDKLSSIAEDNPNNSAYESLYCVVSSHLQKIGESTLQDLAFALDLDIKFIVRGISLFCRLNLIQKRTVPLQPEQISNGLGNHSSMQTKWHTSWLLPVHERSSDKTEDSTITSILAEIKKLSAEEKGKVDENRVWEILNFIENWQRTRDTSSPHYQQLLTEVKTTLLPLIPVKEQQTITHFGVPDNEIMRFDDVFKLVINEPNWTKLISKANKKMVSNIVSVCGDTHVGKSTLISSLLKEGKSEGSHPDVAAPAQNSPTTAHVQYYDSPETLDNMGTLRYLDLEGENGGKPPKNALSQKLESLLSMLGITEYQQRRRKAVSENMPRLAFVTSDIVIFIWNESFANASYMDRVRKLVFDATESVDSSTAPALILIYNKCGLEEEFDIEKCTEKFFENEENLEIKKLYSIVKAVCVPHLDQVKKVKAPGKPTLMIDGEEIYALQIQKLHKLILEILAYRMRLREKEGLLFSEYVWCLLVKTVVERFDQKLRMGEILCGIVKPKETFAIMAFDFFRETYNYCRNFSKEKFLETRESAFQMMAFLFVDHVKQKQIEFDRFLINSAKSNQFKQELYKIFGDLYFHLRNMEPCEATFPGVSQKVCCTTERMMHGPYHRTSTKIFTPSNDPSLVSRVLQNAQAWFNIGYRPIWDGGHQFNYLESFDSEFQKFTNTIQVLAKLMPSNYFLTRVSLLQKAINGVKQHRPTVSNTLCWICLQAVPDKYLLPCYHSFCANCINQLSTISPEQVAVSLNLFTVEGANGLSQFEAPVLQANQCPVCLVRISSIESNVGNLVSLRNKLLGIVHYQTQST